MKGEIVPLIARTSEPCGREGPPGLAGAYSDEEGPMSAKGQNPVAQRTCRNDQALQSKLHQAAKKDLDRRFGILYDKVFRWEVLWTAWLSRI
jgi:hypothetical protein